MKNKHQVFSKASCFLIGFIALIMGAAVPIFFKSIDTDVLTLAGEDTMTLSRLQDEFLNQGKIGPSQLITDEDFSTEQHQRILTILDDNPMVTISGGPSPYFERFLNQTNLSNPSAPSENLLHFLIRPKNRKALHLYLQDSININVQKILQCRSIYQSERFFHINSAAGAPLDAITLGIALYAQGNYFQTAFIRDLRNTIIGSNNGNHISKQHIDQFFISFLGMSKRFKWAELSELISLCKTPDSFNKMSALFRTHPKYHRLFYKILVLSGNPDATIAYLNKFGKQGLEDIKVATTKGSGSIQHLLFQNLPIDNNNGLSGIAKTPLPSSLNQFLTKTCLDSSLLGLSVKIMLLFIAGFSFSKMIQDVKEKQRMSYRNYQNLNTFVILRNCAFALLFTAIALFILEPVLLHQETASPFATIQANFAVANFGESLKTNPMGKTVELDLVAGIILGMFFIIQLAIYLYCLVRITEVKKQDAKPQLKLKLLQNEENLFDSGLYVGLGGTVISLILLVAGVLQASLIAAYASTLFGIIFVAILKIFNVRPYASQLIIENEDNATQS